MHIATMHWPGLDIYLVQPMDVCLHRFILEKPLATQSKSGSEMFFYMLTLNNH